MHCTRTLAHTHTQRLKRTATVVGGDDEGQCELPQGNSGAPVRQDNMSVHTLPPFINLKSPSSPRG
jgi:hypothetical protein